MLGVFMRVVSVSGMPVSGCPFGFGRWLALGGGPKEGLAAGVPLLFQRGVGLLAFEVFVQEPSEPVDGYAGLEDREDSLAKALGLAHENGFLALLFVLLLGFQLALPFRGVQHLRGVVCRLAFHRTSPLMARRPSPDPKRMEPMVLRMAEKNFWF